MRNRGQHNQADQDDSTVTGTDTLTGMLDNEQLLGGRHRRPTEANPRIPGQKGPREALIESLAGPQTDPDTEADADEWSYTITEFEPEYDAEYDDEWPALVEPEVAAPTDAPAIVIPETARWTASNLPRVFAGALLAMAALGTSTLGVRYEQSRTADDFVALVISVAIVVALWGIMIASTPQVLTLNGSVLAIHNSRGVERFDLADGMQPVDVVGEANSSKWAVLLHRPDATTVVLRRHDVVAAQLDPVVRHYRKIAAENYAARQLRFNR